MSRTGLALGEAGVPHDDPNYEGTGESSPLSMNYFREQYLEFQAMLNAVDEAFRAGVELRDVAPSPELESLLSEYEGNASTWRGLADTLNMGAQLVNAAGGRMPVLSLPSTLGAGPLMLALPLVVIAAVGSITTWVAWGRGFAQGVRSLADAAKADPAFAAPESQAALDRIAGQVIEAQRKIDFSPFSGIAGIGESVVKWGLLAVGGYLAWRAWMASRDGD